VRARTLAEGRALAQIDHPNVVHLRAVAVEGPHLYLVMQYIEGESLDRIIARHVQQGDPFPVDEALGIFRQVAAGVGAAHGEGVIHRDLKPANVILRKKDKVAKVTDFGIALVPSDTSRPHTRGILGSLWYMSPEQVTGRRDLDQRVDVYALGIMLYQMLVGHVPFDAKSDYEIMKLHAEAPMPLAAATRPDLPPAVDELIQKACAKDRDRRFQTCEELVAAVDRLLGLGPASMLPGHVLSFLPPPVVAGLAPAPGGGSVPPPSAAGASAPGASSSVPIPLVPMAQPTLGVAEDGALPGPRRRRRGLWALLAVVLVAGGAGAALATGLVPGTAKLFGGGSRHTHTSGADAGAPRSTAPAADGGARLDPLAGTWVSNGRELVAVATGSDLEFRVKKPEQFAPQGYEAGEARFVLHATADAGVYTVEDRIRPVPPTGKLYDPRARGTCQEVWTAVGGEPLRARYDGARLSVEFAKIEPGAANFTLEGARVTSCVGLRNLRASKVVSVLVRP
jgi:eukaryotic-like serine/threonine-protein kinase